MAVLTLGPGWVGGKAIFRTADCRKKAKIEKLMRLFWNTSNRIKSTCNTTLTTKRSHIFLLYQLRALPNPISIIQFLEFAFVANLITQNKCRPIRRL